MNRLHALLGIVAAAAIGCSSSSTTTTTSDAATGHDLAMSSDLSAKGDMATGTGDMSMAAAPTCASYCAAVTSACTANKTVTYPDTATCMTYCQSDAALPIGTAADTSGDTVGCRTYHASLAAMSVADATTHCPHAGPSGGNTCGTWCENYCDLAAKNCTGANQLYANATDCMTACTGAGTGAFTAGMPNDSSGNTIQCRIYHLGTLAANDPATHCPHGQIPTSAACQ